MSLQHIPHLLELLGFLSSPRPEVRRIALANLLPYTHVDHSERSLFQREHYLEDVASLCADQDLIAHDALSALINLTNSAPVALRLSKLDNFLPGLVNMIVSDKALLSDLACMLLSNMTKIESISIQLLNLRLPFPSSSSATASTPTDSHPDDVEALDLLLEVFLKGEGKKYNPNANYDFLASVFANVSTIAPGRAYLLATPAPSLEPPLSKLISFTEHPSTIRRGGVASSIKNSAFDKSAHARLIAPTNDSPPVAGSIDLLPQMLLPLCGPEEFDLDVLDTLPEELQLLPPTKVRETDPAIRLILVEALVLLATTRTARESMRVRGVYEVIKAAHLAEVVPKCTEPMVRLVNLLMREEGEDTAIEEIDEVAGEPHSETILVDAEGKEAKQEGSFFTQSAVPKAEEPEEEEDEDMVLEVM